MHNTATHNTDAQHRTDAQHSGRKNGLARLIDGRRTVAAEKLLAGELPALLVCWIDSGVQIGLLPLCVAPCGKCILE